MSGNSLHHLRYCNGVVVDSFLYTSISYHVFSLHITLSNSHTMTSLNSGQAVGNSSTAMFGLLVLLLIPIGVAVAFYFNCIKCWSRSTVARGGEGIPEQASASELPGRVFVSEPPEQVFVVEPPEQVFVVEVEEPQEYRLVTLGRRREHSRAQTYVRSDGDVPSWAVAVELFVGQQLVTDHHIILRPCDHVCQTATVPTDQEISVLSSIPLHDAHIV